MYAFRIQNFENRVNESLPSDTIWGNMESFPHFFFLNDAEESLECGFCVYRSDEGEVVGGGLQDAAERREAHRLPLRPPDLLHSAGGEPCSTYMYCIHTRNYRTRADLQYLETLLLPTTATGASPRAPSAGSDCHYISGLRHIFRQWHRSNRLPLQEKVIFTTER